MKRVLAFKMLLGRSEACRENVALLSDVRLGLRRLREAGAVDEGRIGTLRDLEQQADDVENTQDPETITRLLDSLRAFLQEEIDEESGESTEGGGDMNGQAVKGPDPATAPEHEELTEEGRSYVCEACGHENSLQEMAASTGSVPGPVEADADPVSSPEDENEERMESEDVKEDEEETEPESAKRESAGGMMDADRAELMLLRKEKQNREIRAKRLTEADRAIKAAKVDMKAADLVPFDPRQWPTIIGMANRILGPSSGVGGGERSYAAFAESERKPARNARQVFEAAFE